MRTRRARGNSVCTGTLVLTCQLWIRLFADLLSEGEHPVRVSDEVWFELSAILESAGSAGTSKWWSSTDTSRMSRVIEKLVESVSGVPALAGVADGPVGRAGAEEWLTGPAWDWAA